MPLDLPDVYETRQGRALAEALEKAHETDDIQPALRILDHLAAESGAPAGPEMETLKDTLLATFLFKLAITFRERGQDTDADWYMSMLANLCSSEAQQRTLSGAFYRVGCEQGWLEARHYDLVAGALAQFSDSPEAQQMRHLFSTVERRDTPPTDGQEPGPAGTTG